MYVFFKFVGLMLAVACLCKCASLEKMEASTKIGSLKELCGRQIPEGVRVHLDADEELNCQIRVRSGFVLNGNDHRIVFGPSAEIRIENARDVIIENTHFSIGHQKLDQFVPEEGRALLSFQNTTNILLSQNHFLIDLEARAAKFSELSNGIPLGKVLSVLRWEGTNTDVRIIGNDFRSKSMYTSRVFFDALPVDIEKQTNSDFGVRTSSRREVIAPKINWVIKDNSIRRFHGAIYVPWCTNCEISSNFLTLNSFGNIVVTGKNIQVSGNAIRFPGAGSSGDGITVGAIEDGRIVNNRIVYGTCYGIWINEKAKNLLISKNNISSGITAGINFEAPPGSSESVFENIVLEENVFNNNKGPGLRLSQGEQMTIRKNFFIHDSFLTTFEAREFAQRKITLEKNFFIKDVQPLHAANLEFISE